MFEAEGIADQIVDEVTKVVRRIRGDAELAKQMRNATQSLSNNIGEGAGRFGRDRVLLFSYAYGSGRELRRQLKFAVAFGHVTAEELERVHERLDHLLAILWKLTHPR